MKESLRQMLVVTALILSTSVSICFADEIEKYSIVTRPDAPAMVFSVVRRDGHILTVRRVDSAKMFLSMAARTHRDIRAISLVPTENDEADHIMAIGHDDAFMDLEEIQMPLDEVQQQFIRLENIPAQETPVAVAEQPAGHNRLPVRTILSPELRERAPVLLQLSTGMTVAPQNEDDGVDRSGGRCCGRSAASRSSNH